MGNLWFVSSCYEEAETFSREAIEHLPGVACPYWCIADVYDKLGYWNRAEEYYRLAVEVDPLNTQASEKLEEWLTSNRNERKRIANDQQL